MLFKTDGGRCQASPQRRRRQNALHRAHANMLPAWIRDPWTWRVSARSADREGTPPTENKLSWRKTQPYAVVSAAI
eukprot:5874838-Pyramimonas_sp.AAC.1